MSFPRLGPKQKWTRTSDGHPVTIERCSRACGCYGARLTVRERNDCGTSLGHEDAKTFGERYHGGDPDTLDALFNKANLNRDQRYIVRTGLRR